jgi:Bacteriophage head to tail connecting protein
VAQDLAGRKVSDADVELHRHVNERLLGLRVNRYSWWVHARELADFLLPRRYKWLITPNQMTRGSPINQHILDSTGTIAARNLASGMMSGISSPTRPWFRLKIGRIDSTQTSPISLWLAECERLMMLVFQESNFYNSVATVYFDLVVFGTSVMLIYEDFDNVIHCYNPCFGEYYLDNDGKFRPVIFYREFTLTIAQVVDQFGRENCSTNVVKLYDEGKAGLTREIIVAHAIEPNDNPRKYGIPNNFKYREVYWEWGGSASPQGGISGTPGFLRKRGFFEAPHIAVRWDLVSNDAYGRSPGMDALPDIKQLQQEVRRKAQAIDKTVNPPMVADIQLKNQPASLLPGGTTYIAGMMQTGNAGFAPVYGNWRPGIAEISEDLNEIRARIKTIFFNDLFQVISQFQTRSNVSATEIDARRSEAMVMIGPVLERIQYELLDPIIDRTFAVMSRAGVLPKAPPEIAGQNIDIEYVSMLLTAQLASATSGIERTLQLVGGLVGVDPGVMDNIDVDFAVQKYSNLMNNDPRLIRSPEALKGIRQQRQQEAAQQQQAAQAEQASKMAAGAKTLSETDIGGGGNALQAMMGGGGA